jgi:hypothetical protein
MVELWYPTLGVHSSTTTDLIPSPYATFPVDYQSAYELHATVPFNCTEFPATTRIGFLLGKIETTSLPQTNGNQLVQAFGSVA